MFCLTLRLGVLLLTFFVFKISLASTVRDEIISKALEKSIYSNYKWKNLLHLEDNKPAIKDNNFILSLDNFSLKNELIETIYQFLNDNLSENHAICRFPSRYEFIKKELDLDDSYFPKPFCLGFDEYLKKTKADNITLVFVSEDVVNPSSMMGHTFFKISGDNRSHAVSFFTVIETINLPLLLIESTLTGMKGIFALAPYDEQIYRYLKIENRNIWEYVLNLSEYDKKLIYYHLWELKDVKMKYYFTGYNCATVVHNILSIASPEISKKKRFWVTPKDVIKDAYNSGIVSEISLIPSDKWFIKMLQEYSNVNLSENIYSSLSKVQLDNLKFKEFKVIETELLKSYSEFLYKNQKIGRETLKKIYDLIDNDEYNGYKIDLSQYKSPVKTRDDSQLSLSYIKKNGKFYLGLSFLPASNKLSDDNREYFSESSLKIAETNIITDFDSIKLDSFTLYGMKSLVPYSKFTKDYSLQFRMSYEGHYDNDLSEHKAINISGGFGYDYRFFKDIDTYVLISQP